MSLKTKDQIGGDLLKQAADDLSAVIVDALPIVTEQANDVAINIRAKLTQYAQVSRTWEQDNTE